METINSCVSPGSQTKSRWKSGSTMVREWISTRSSLSALGFVSSNRLMSHSSSTPSRWSHCSLQQFGEIVVHTGNAEIWLALEGLAQVMHSLRLAGPKLDDRKDEIVWLVERVEDLVLGDRNGVGAGHAPLNLDETQLPGPRYAAFDVVAKLLGFPVSGFEPKRPLSLHDGRTRP